MNWSLDMKEGVLLYCVLQYNVLRVLCCLLVLSTMYYQSLTGTIYSTVVCLQVEVPLLIDYNCTGTVAPICSTAVQRSSPWSIVPVS